MLSPAIPIPTMIVDDQSDVRFLIRTIIEGADHGLFVTGEAASGHEALARIEQDDPVVVVLDEMMPAMSGLETLRHIRRTRPRQVVIMCSAFLDDDLAERAHAFGAEAWISKEEIHGLPEMIRQAVSA